MQLVFSGIETFSENCLALPTHYLHTNLVYDIALLSRREVQQDVVPGLTVKPPNNHHAILVDRRSVRVPQRHQLVSSVLRKLCDPVHAAQIEYEGVRVETLLTFFVHVLSFSVSVTTCRTISLHGK